MDELTLKNDPLWFKNAIIYEVPVRAFADSNGDGIGDFRGLTGKLDYLQDLGVTAIWLLPFFPSPLRDDGYDIADYMNVNPIYGTLDDFKELLQAAHQRGIRVIIELIVNHTSDQHPWFQRARRSPKGSPERDFYVWSDTYEKYQEARIIFQDFETSNWTWDSVANAYFWHRFYSHQPDLNYDNPAVQQAVFDVMDFWLEMGVDGLRMDAVPYLYEREGTNCENLPETHAFLKQLRQHVDENFPNRMLLAEANQWPEDAAAYFGEGDECHMNFHFPLMPRLFMALRMEDSFPIADILQQTPAIPDNCQWGLFLRNHDELTLEMVTDEDRDFMYRVYAQDPEMRVNLGIRRRLAPLLGNDRRQIELLNSLLLSLPGTPVLYYGDEIGMGDNVYVGDRNGVRTPMQWNFDRNAGFSSASPQRLFLPLIVEAEYHYATVNVEAQRANPTSLLNAMKRLLAMRKHFQALGSGDFQILHPENRKVLAFTRTYEDEKILVVANLSRFVQTVELELSALKGWMPVEIFGRTEFPPIDESPYFLSIGAYAVYWFTLKPQVAALPEAAPLAELPMLDSTWQRAFARLQSAEARSFAASLETLLPRYLASHRWFGGRTRTVQTAHIVGAIAIPYGSSHAQMVELQVDYIQGDPQTYVLFLAMAEGDQALQLLADLPQAVVARLKLAQSDDVAVLFDAIADKAFLTALLEGMARHQIYENAAGKLLTTKTALFDELSRDQPGTSIEGDASGGQPGAGSGGGLPFEPTLLKGLHNNTSIAYGKPGSIAPQNRLILKLFQKVEEGLHPDLEVRRFLDRHQHFSHIPSIAGTLDYHRPDAEPITIGLLQEFIPDTRSAWDYTIDHLRDYFDLVVMDQSDIAEAPMPVGSPLALEPATGVDPEASPEEVFFPLPYCPLPSVESQIPACKAINSYLANIQLLGQRTAELHIALSVDADTPAFAPEPFTSLYQRSIYQYSRNLIGHVFLLLKNRLSTLPPDTRSLAALVLGQHDACLERFQSVLNHKITALRTRCHGDYHLEQVLYTGKDFVIIDFEGDPARTLSERRMKRSPLRDVASMLQSFYYAATIALDNEIESGMSQPEQRHQLQQWAEFWYRWVSTTFTKAYLATAARDSFLPQTQRELEVLLGNYLIEQAIYNLGQELVERSTHVKIPLRRILYLLAIDLDGGVVTPVAEQQVQA
ncbi:maltose alpha-D-glucosyltransferase [Nodosilinea nodulosa]|uniref:maltose alpha-D-glucosyltransferase n=1 Tax=Nodosilinea nodulosa TaxID=416001 RepID=UPI00036C845A|nr:maltose alpha-D-glucosyltransferase [Nodosilinea nodulosa]